MFGQEDRREGAEAQRAGRTSSSSTSLDEQPDVEEASNLARSASVERGPEVI